MTDLQRLFDPFPKEAISWRAQSVSKNGDALALAYIDARDVMRRLNEVCGIAGWQCKYSHANGKTICDIGIKCGDEWIWKADGAGDTDIEAEKGAISDAFKRAAVKWGVGMYLYDLDSPWVPCEVEEYNGKKKWKGWKRGVSPWDFVKNVPVAPSVRETGTDSKIRFNAIQADLAGCETPKALLEVLAIYRPAINEIQSGDAQIREEMNKCIKAAKEHVALEMADVINRHTESTVFAAWWAAQKAELMALQKLDPKLYESVLGAKDIKKNQLTNQKE